MTDPYLPPETVRAVARGLLDIKAVVFTPDAPLTFKSGIQSPVYVDNRRLPFWPEQWRTVIEAMQAYITAAQPAYDIIAGIAAGGVPHSSALAYQLGVPSVFVRKEAKGHGTGSRIEGGDVTGQRVLLVEDLVTTGGSSLAGVDALREAGAVVTDCLCIVTYGFAEARAAFQQAGMTLHPLTPFLTLVDEALGMGHFGPAERDLIAAWMDDPHNWGKAE